MLKQNMNNYHIMLYFFLFFFQKNILNILFKVFLYQFLELITLFKKKK